MALNPPAPSKEEESFSAQVLIPTWTPRKLLFQAQKMTGLTVFNPSTWKGVECMLGRSSGTGQSGSEAGCWPQWGPEAPTGPPQPQQPADERTQAKQPSAE